MLNTDEWKMQLSQLPLATREEILNSLSESVSAEYQRLVNDEETLHLQICRRLHIDAERRGGRQVGSKHGLLRHRKFPLTRMAYNGECQQIHDLVTIPSQSQHNPGVAFRPKLAYQCVH